jgi:hypothetical protein
MQGAVGPKAGGMRSEGKPFSLLEILFAEAPIHAFDD